MQYRIFSHTYTPANFLYAYFAIKLLYLLTFSAPDNHFFDFCYYQLDFFSPDFFSNAIIQCVPFGAWLSSLSIMSGNSFACFICQQSFLFIAGQYAIVWVQHNLFFCLQCCQTLGCLELGGFIFVYKISVGIDFISFE